MAYDLLLLFCYSAGSEVTLNSFMVLFLSVTTVLGVLGDVDFFTVDTESRKEFLANKFTSEAIAAPFWKYAAILPTHTTSACLKILGAFHLLCGGGARWLLGHPPAGC